jgi:hypothetical protein
MKAVSITFYGLFILCIFCSNKDLLLLFIPAKVLSSLSTKNMEDLFTTLSSKALSSENLQKVITAEDFWFPGRWIGAVSLIVSPLLLLVGALLRFPFHFFFPQQLQAFDQYPTLMQTSYSLFLAGNLLLWPAILTLTHLIGKTQPAWSLWGGTMVLLGLFARTFHAGIDHMAFQLVDSLHLEAATKLVANSYGAFHIVSALSACIFFGWIVLAIGAYRSGIFGWFFSIALASMAALMIGVLKGSSWVSLLSICGLSVALLPLGITLLLAKPKPSRAAVFGWSLLMIAVVTLLFFSGQVG